MRGVVLSENPAFVVPPAPACAPAPLRPRPEPSCGPRRGGAVRRPGVQGRAGQGSLTCGGRAHRAGQPDAPRLHRRGSVRGAHPCGGRLRCGGSPPLNPTCITKCPSARAATRVSVALAGGKCLQTVVCLVRARVIFVYVCGGPGVGGGGLCSSELCSTAKRPPRPVQEITGGWCTKLRQRSGRRVGVGEVVRARLRMRCGRGGGRRRWCTSWGTSRWRGTGRGTGAWWAAWPPCWTSAPAPTPRRHPPPCTHTASRAVLACNLHKCRGLLELARPSFQTLVPQARKAARSVLKEVVPSSAGLHGRGNTHQDDVHT